MSQSLIYTLLALLLLLGGIFILRRLWMGALAGVLFLGITHMQASGMTSLQPAAADALLIWTELGLLIFGAYLFYQLLHQQKQMENFHQKIGASGAGLSVVLLFGWGFRYSGDAGGSAAVQFWFPSADLRYHSTGCQYCLGNFWRIGNRPAHWHWRKLAP